MIHLIHTLHAPHATGIQCTLHIVHYMLHTTYTTHATCSAYYICKVNATYYIMMMLHTCYTPCTLYMLDTLYTTCCTLYATLHARYFDTTHYTVYYMLHSTRYMLHTPHAEHYTTYYYYCLRHVHDLHLHVACTTYCTHVYNQCTTLQCKHNYGVSIIVLVS